MEQHIKVLAVLNIVLGALGLIGALFIFVFLGGLAGLEATNNDAAALGMVGAIA